MIMIFSFSSLSVETDQGFSLITVCSHLSAGGPDSVPDSEPDLKHSQSQDNHRGQLTNPWGLSEVTQRSGEQTLQFHSFLNRRHHLSPWRQGCVQVHTERHQDSLQLTSEAFILRLMSCTLYFHYSISAEGNLVLFTLLHLLWGFSYFTDEGFCT